MRIFILVFINPLIFVLWLRKLLLVLLPKSTLCRVRSLCSSFAFQNSCVYVSQSRLSIKVNLYAKLFILILTPSVVHLCSAVGKTKVSFLCRLLRFIRTLILVIISFLFAKLWKRNLFHPLILLTMKRKTLDPPREGCARLVPRSGHRL